MTDPAATGRAPPARRMVPTRWSELEPLLDQALDADEPGRAALLADLHARDGALADELRSLLQDSRSADAAQYLQAVPMPPSWQPPAAGDALGAYTLVAPIGDGGMGSVWLARRSDGRFDGLAAVKLLNRGMASAAIAERFRREGQILARLDHPHIARLLDAGLTPHGQAYLVLEHVRGQSIDTWCDARRLPVAARVRLFATLLAAVAHAHRHLVVHRDIKPGNVMVSDDGQVKLLDFGIAKLLADELDAGSATESPLTQQAGGLLTPGYAAPEQYLGEPVTTATDVYALGVLLYGLLAGRHPTLGPTATAGQAMQATLGEDAPRMSLAVAHPDLAAAAETAAQRATQPATLRRQLAGDLDNIVARALQRAPADRYPDAAALADDLQCHLDHRPVLARAPGPVLRLAKFARRQRAPLAVAGVALVALLVVGGNAWQQRQAAREGQARAQSVDGLLQSLFEGMSPDNAASRVFTARELLDRGRAFLDSGAGLDPATRRDARLRMAGLYRDIGALDEAATLYRAEVDAAAAQGQAVLQAQALLRLANVQLKAPTTMAQAEQTLQTAGRLIDTATPGDADLRGRHRLLRGEWLLETQPPAQAAVVLAQAAELLGQPASPDLEWLARAVDDQAEAARRAGDLALALQHLERAARLQAQRGAAGTVDSINTRVRLGRLQNFVGDFAAAAGTLAQAHAELVARLGPQHLDTLEAANELGYAQLRSGRLAEARATADSLVKAEGPAAVWRRLDGQTLLAMMAMYRSEPAAAEPVLRQVLASVEQAEGGPTRSTEPLRRLHAESLLRLSRHTEALATLRQTERQQIALSHTGHSSVAITRVLIGCGLARTGDLAGARQAWVEASAVLSRDLGAKHPFALTAASYAALTEPAPLAVRAALAQRLETEVGWQHGAADLARRLRASVAPGDWTNLPVVL